MTRQVIELPGHELFHFNSCPFCLKVRMALKLLRLDVPLRNIKRNRAFKQQLIDGGGKKQVPCLRIEDREGKVRWLYESAEIVRYLKETQGRGTP